MSTKTSPKFILGTHRIGDNNKDPLATIDHPKDVRAVLDAFRSRGYDQIDSASNYPPNAPGSSEIRLGEAGAAQQFVIHTKVRDGPPGSHEPSKINISLNRTLDALKTKSVETLFLHVPDRQTPFEDTLKAINDAHRQQKFRKFGLSNYTASEVKRIIEICEANGYVKPSVYEGHYNAIVRSGEAELFPLLREHKIAFFAYSPAAGGFFSGNPNSAQWSNDNNVGQLYNSIYGPVRDVVTTIQSAVKKHGITTHEAALRWVAFHSALDGQYGDGVVFGVSKIEQVDKTLDALEAGKLPDDVAEAISAVYETIKGSEPAYHL